MASINMTNKDPVRRSKHFGPYRATKLWNELLRAFRHGMPSRRHRRHMKSYDDCFSASEAVTWLLDHLRNNPNYGPSVTRSQAVQLLDKFHKWRVFEDVRGLKHNKDSFSDSGRLFRFIGDSGQTPVKSRATPARVPLATRTALMNNAASPELKPSDKFKKMGMDKPLTEASLEAENQVTGSAVTGSRRADRMGDKGAPGEEQIQLTEQETQAVWKTMLLNRLQAVLHVHTLADIVDADSVTASDVIHNMTQLNKNGVVTNIQEKDQLPKWVLRAMRYLAYWPDAVEDVPRYDGFVRDVFNAIRDDYFARQPEPLCSFAMYDVFTNVMATLEDQEQVRMPAAPPPRTSASSSLQPYNSLEDLMADLTVNALPSAAPTPVPPSDVMIVHDAPPFSPHPRPNMPDLVQQCGAERAYGTGAYRAPQMGRYHSASSLPGTRYETSFGVDSNEPKTRVMMNRSARDVADRAGGALSASSKISPEPRGRVATPNSAASNSSGQSRIGLARASWSRDSARLPSATTLPGRRSVTGNDCSPEITLGGARRPADTSTRSHPSTTSITSDLTNAGHAFPGEVFTEEEKRKLGLSIENDADSAAGKKLRYPSGGYRPRTCPLNGTYRGNNALGGFIVARMNNVVPPAVQPPPPYVAPPRYADNSSASVYSSYQPLERSQTNLSRSHTSISYNGDRSQTSTSYSGERSQTSTSHNSDRVLSRTRSSATRANSSYHSTYTPPHVTTPVGASRDVTSSQSSGDTVFVPSPCGRLGSAGSPDRLSSRGGSESVFYGAEEQRGARGRSVSAERSHTFSAADRPQSLAAAETSYSSRDLSVQRRSGCNLAESYMLAVDRAEAPHTPVGKSLFSTSANIRKTQSTPNMCVASSRMLEALQLCTLMLSPASRRKLHLLLRFMNKIVHNQRLTLDKSSCARDLVLATFSRCILRSPEEIDLNEILCMQIVAFMMDNYTELMQVPDQLKHVIQDKLDFLRKTKRHFFRAGFERGVTYCQQMSLRDYELQRRQGAQQSLACLLNAIVDDDKMAAKEKKRRIKQFQKAHPDIYQRRFPTSRSESDLYVRKPKPPLLSRPLHKLKTLRL